MSPNGPKRFDRHGTAGIPVPYTRKPESELRHWSTYRTASEYYADYQGYVPLPMMVGISQVMRERGVGFVEAYRLLLEGGAIIHVDEADDPRKDD